MPNPYEFGSGLDDDIFEVDEAAPDLTNLDEVLADERDRPINTIEQVCERLGVDYNDMPPEMARAFDKIIESMPEGSLDQMVGIATGQIAPTVRMVVSFMKFINELDKTLGQNAYMRAVGEKIEGNFDFTIEQLCPIYETEFYLVVTHLTLKSANNAFEDYSQQTEKIEDSKKSSEEDKNYDIPFLSLLGFIRELMIDRKDWLSR
jgi:replicative superfamily II helicase